MTASNSQSASDPRFSGSFPSGSHSPPGSNQSSDVRSSLTSSPLSNQPNDTLPHFTSLSLSDQSSASPYTGPSLTSATSASQSNPPAYTPTPIQASSSVMGGSAHANDDKRSREWPGLDAKDAQPALPSRREAKYNADIGEGSRYVYYQIYSQDGVVPTNNPIYANDAFVSRAQVSHIPPPHTGASVARFIARQEDIPASKSVKLFTSFTNLSAVETHKAVDLHSTTVGKSPEQPFCLVVGTTNQQTSHSTPPTSSPSFIPVDGFNTKIRALVVHEGDNCPPLFLPYIEGEIMYTDGKMHTTKRFPKEKYYAVRNAAGNTGYVNMKKFEYVV